MKTSSHHLLVYIYQWFLIKGILFMFLITNQKAWDNIPSTYSMHCTDLYNSIRMWVLHVLYAIRKMKWELQVATNKSMHSCKIMSQTIYGEVTFWHICLNQHQGGSNCLYNRNLDYVPDMYACSTSHSILHLILLDKTISPLNIHIWYFSRVNQCVVVGMVGT